MNPRDRGVTDATAHTARQSRGVRTLLSRTRHPTKLLPKSGPAVRAVENTNYDEVEVFGLGGDPELSTSLY